MDWRATIQKMQPQFEEKQQQLQKEVETLAAAMKKERIEMEAALAQIDKVLNLECEIKRDHLAMVIGMKNKLSKEQQAKLQEIRMEAQMEKVKAGVEKWQNDGRDPSSIAEIMQEFEPLMKAGKLHEAEAILDRALKLPSGQEKEKSEQPENKRSDAPARQFQARAKAIETPEELKAEIEVLRDAKVAWRGIAWKRCLLDALKEARARKKPIIVDAFNGEVYGCC